MILITGGTGQIGTALRRLLPDAIAPGRDMLDLADPGSLGERLTTWRPEAIINCAGYTAVDDAELHQRQAFAVNCDAVAAMAGFAAERAIPFVTFSTDNVFDGTASIPYVESSPTGPLNAYGRSKEAGERAARRAYPDALVIRTSWLISPARRSFTTRIVELARRGPVTVVADQVGSPTIVDDLAAGVLTALGRRLSGLLHLVSAGPASRLDLARAACTAAGIDPGRVVPIGSAEFGARALRPSYAVLDSERDDTPRLPPWRDALARSISRPGG